MDLEEPSTKSLEPKAPRIKEVLKERKVLEKKVALSKKRKKDSRYIFYLATFPLYHSPSMLSEERHQKCQ